MPIKDPKAHAFALWKKFTKDQKMSDFFLWFSHEVWESQKFARFSKTYETELTNLLVRSLMQAIYYEKKSFPIRIFHAHNESTNGRDLEIIYQLAPNKNIKFYCQAKRLYTDKPQISEAKYEALDYKDKTHDQIKNLMDHSRDGGYPLYLFYNYTDDVKIDYNFGCTFVSAYYLHKLHSQDRRDLSNLRFQDLKRVAQPLTSLCASWLTTYNIVDIIAAIKQWEGGINCNSYIKFFDDKIFDNPKEKKWQEFLKPCATTQGTALASTPVPKNAEIDDSIFNPQYRIVITQKSIAHIDREPYHL